ncbi:CDGSH iron-sulfur domain-containing protein [Nocardioides sp.]|uniref:CDGSH iron-sulfur domain-containing protein n=1 Tax=Nocardioides sp. TaxID=35761 RepID=UPI003567E7C0
MTAEDDRAPIRPTLVRGASIVADTDGQLHRVTRPVVALCACGRSRIAPWCDSTHKLLHRRAGADDA